MSIKSWEVSDAFWGIVEPLIPKPRRDKEKQYKRVVGGGRKPLVARKVFPPLSTYCEQGFSGKHCPKRSSEVRAQFIDILENGSKKVFSWNFGCAACPSMTTWKE